MSSTDAGTGFLGPIAPRGLGDEVYDALLDMLTSGDLPPDSPLAIDRLARRLSVSPTPVREALARLEHTGLVKRAAHKGYRVAPPLSAEQMEELVDARLVLETGAIKRAMNDQQSLSIDLHAAFDQHLQAAQQLDSARGVQDRDKIHAYFDADWSFHQVILDHSGNRYINRSVNALAFTIHRMRQTIGRGTTDADIAIEEHRKILEAVEANDAPAVLKAMRDHLTNVSIRTAPQSGAPTDRRQLSAR